MEMTLVEEILNGYAGEEVKLSPDICMINDGEGHKCIELVDESKGIAKKESLLVVLDHDIPAGSFQSAANQKKLIDFSKKNDIEFIQSVGIGYQILLEGHVKEMDIAVSCGSHNSYWGAIGALGVKVTTEEMAELVAEGEIACKVPETVKVELKGSLRDGVTASEAAFKLISMGSENEWTGKVIELTGDGLENLVLDERITLCSMATQSGALAAMINESPRGNYVATFEMSLTDIIKSVIRPEKLELCTADDEIEGMKVHAGFIGGCMGGRIESIRKAAKIVKGKRVKRGVRMMVGFASNDVYLKAMDEGLVDVFIDCGAQVTNPGCGSCKTTSIGVVGDDEVMITTGSYNYPGCCGTEKSKVYIASPDVVAGAMLTGYVNTGK